MQKIKYILLASIFIVIAIICFRHKQGHKKNDCHSLIPNIEIPVEVNFRYLILDHGEIVFSANDSSDFFLKSYFEGRVKDIVPQIKSAFNPVIIAGEISAVYDSNGNEEFKTTSDKLHEYIGTSSIQSIYSFQHGNLVFIKLSNDRGLYLIDLKSKTKKRIVDVAQKLHGVSFNVIKNSFVISYDDKIILFDVSIDSITHLADNLEGEKLNPFIYNNDVYFANNSLSEFYQIFKIDLYAPKQFDAKPFFKQEHDLRIPKAIDHFLYFIEIINSEYLLKRVNLQTSEIDNITQAGVVYNYDFLKNRQIAMVYSDLTTPKSLMIYNDQDRSFVNISGSKVNLEITSSFVISQNNASSAYILQGTNIETRGVVLFIRPGMHSDFSPRWVDVLMNLCNNGYTILAPNFPMSTGYGKSFYNATFQQAMDDLNDWKKYLQKQYKGIPLYCLSMSSGNIFMEELLSQNSKGFKAAVSLFGVPGKPNKKSFSVPTLYILGENDPVVNFHDRYATLLEYQKKHPTISVISYPDEGHWFRGKRNTQNAIEEIIRHFCTF